MDNNIKVPHMETIKATAEMFGLPIHFVRSKAKNGEIVSVRAGERYLVNVDKFAEYLNTNKEPQPESPTSNRAINI
jgi:hypothetical protein